MMLLILSQIDFYFHNTLSSLYMVPLNSLGYPLISESWTAYGLNVLPFLYPMKHFAFVSLFFNIGKPIRYPYFFNIYIIHIYCFLGEMKLYFFNLNFTAIKFLARFLISHFLKKHFF